MFLLIIIIIIQIWKKEGKWGGGGLWRKTQDAHWRAGKLCLGQCRIALPHIWPICLAPLTLRQSTKGDPRCQQADSIWTLPHWDINQRHDGPGGREIALYSLYFLYYLMPRKSVYEGRDLPRYRPQNHNLPVYRPRLLLKCLPNHSHGWLLWPVLK